MIQLNELRIGNLVLLKNDPTKEERVVGLLEDSYNEEGVTLQGLFNDPSTRRWIPISDIMPIKLTKEVLLSYGAKPHTAEGTFLYKNIIVDIKLGTALLDCKEITPFLGICKTVHEFQNLYFSLTGKELEKQSDNEK